MAKNQQVRIPTPIQIQNFINPKYASNSHVWEARQ